MMDDDQLLYSGDAGPRRRAAQDGRRGRRHGARDGAVERRRRPRQDGQGQAQALQQARRRQPEGLPEAATGTATTGSSAPASQLGIGAYFDVTAAGPALGPREGAALAARQPQDVEAQAARVRQVRQGGRQALHRHLQGRERPPRSDPARLRVVARQRAQPGRLADPAVGARQARLAAPVPLAVLRRPPRAGQDRPRRRRDLRRRDRAAGRSDAHDALARAPQALHRAAPVRHGPHRRPAAADFDKYGPAAAHRLGASPVHEAPGAAAARHEPPTRSRWPTSTTCPRCSTRSPPRPATSRAGLPVVSTEFGYETNPPDPFAGISLEKQADYITLGDYITYLNPRDRGQHAVPAARRRRHCASTPRRAGTTGSPTSRASSPGRGKPKPSAQAYAMPFLAQRHRRAAAGDRLGPAALPTQRPPRRSSGPGADRVQAGRRIGGLGAARQPHHRDQRHAASSPARSPLRPAGQLRAGWASVAVPACFAHSRAYPIS